MSAHTDAHIEAIIHPRTRWLCQRITHAHAGCVNASRTHTLAVSTHHTRTRGSSFNVEDEHQRVSRVLCIWSRRGKPTRPSRTSHPSPRHLHTPIRFRFACPRSCLPYSHPQPALTSLTLPPQSSHPQPARPPTTPQGLAPTAPSRLARSTTN